MEDVSERLGLVVELVTLTRPLDDVVADLARHPFDVDMELVALDRGHVISVLERYLAGELDEAAIEEWAAAIELRDDVGMPESDGLLTNAMYELANPELAKPLNPARAQNLLQLLRN